MQFVHSHRGRESGEDGSQLSPLDCGHRPSCPLGLPLFRLHRDPASPWIPALESGQVLGYVFLTDQGEECNSAPPWCLELEGTRHTVSPNHLVL